MLSGARVFAMARHLAYFRHNEPAARSCIEPTDKGWPRRNNKSANNYYNYSDIHLARALSGDSEPMRGWRAPFQHR